MAHHPCLGTHSLQPATLQTTISQLSNLQLSPAPYNTRSPAPNRNLHPVVAQFSLPNQHQPYSLLGLGQGSWLPKRPPLTRESILEWVMVIPQCPVSNEGKQQYQADIDAWHATHGREAILSLSRRTRLMKEEPFYPPRVNTILDTVQIVTISPDKSIKVRALIHEFADVFALSIKEVKPISTIKYQLNIPHGTTFSVKANQRPLNQAPKEFYFPKLTEFKNTRVLCPIQVSKVKAVHPTVLAQKAHETPGLTMDEIRQEVNEQCILLGEPPDPTIPWCTSTPTPQKVQPNQTSQKKPKWRIMQNFGQLSQVCQSAQIPQGDLSAKQQHLAGHQYICIINFASGFYAIEVEEESQLYLCIYMEGIGYHALHLNAHG